MCILSKWSEEMEDRIIRGKYFCIEARDAFTNQPVVSEEVKIFVNGRAPVLKKEDRYYIFNLVEDDILKVQVESFSYEKKSCAISFSQSVKEIQVMPDGMVYPFCGTFLFLILLYPGESDRLPKGYHETEISGNSKEEIRVIKNKEKWYYLAKDYKGGDWIEMYMPEEGDMRGRYFRIEGKEGMPDEDFVVIEEKDGFSYRMKEALRGSYPKGSRIYELFRVNPLPRSCKSIF